MSLKTSQTFVSTHLQVPLPQQTARALFEAVRFLLAVPDRARHRVLLADTVLIHRTERSAAQFLRFLRRKWLICIVEESAQTHLIVRFEPHRLQLAMMAFGEPVILEDVVKLAEMAHLEVDERARPQNTLVVRQFGTAKR